MFPAMALLISRQLRDAAPSALRWHLLFPVAFWVLAFIASTQAYRFTSVFVPAELLAPITAAARVGASAFLVGAIIAWWCLGRRRITAAILCVAVGHLIATTVVMQSHNEFGQLKSSARIVPKLLPLITQDTPVFAVRAYDQTLPFYLGRHVVLVDYVDEFALGESQEPERWIKTVDEFIDRWQSLPQAAAYMDRVTWMELQQRGLPMRIVFEDQRRVVVTKK
jgi:hypothetical protein